MTGARSFWLATLGWGTDPWWDVTGRTARRRARRRLLDLALVAAVLTAVASTSGAGARIAGAAGDTEAAPAVSGPALGPASLGEASVANEPAGAPAILASGGASEAALAQAAAASKADVPLPGPAGPPHLVPWLATLVAMVVGLAATARSRRRPGR